MVEKATGLVLRIRPLTETSLIVQWLTRDAGRVSTVAKGARRPRSPFRGKLDLFYLADFSYARSRRSELHTLREVNLVDTHKALRTDLARLHQAAYCATLLEQVTETETPLTEIFELLNGFLNHLGSEPAQPRGIFAFELQLLAELGLGPDLESASLKPETKELIRSLEQSTWQDLVQLKANKAQALELRRFLHGFLIYHLGKIPPSRERALSQEHAETLPQ